MRTLMAFLGLFSMTAVLQTALPAPAIAQVYEIAAIVNDDAVLKDDLNSRLKMIMISSGMPNSADIREKLEPQILGSLIDEQIRLQEAQRLGIEVTDEDIQNGFAAIAAQNNFEPEQFKAALQKSGIDLETMYRQIRAQVAWTKIMQATLRPRISISDQDIDAVINQLKDQIGTQEFLVAEIFLPVDEENGASNTRQLAQKLVGEMRAGKAPFVKVAQQFSQAAGASKGGDLGWLPESELQENVAQTLSGMDKNELSPPVQTPEGYHIYLLRDKRTISEETIPSREEVRTQLGMERLDRLQRRHFLDLKTAAFIETRAGS